MHNNMTLKDMEERDFLEYTFCTAAFIDIYIYTFIRVDELKYRFTFRGMNKSMHCHLTAGLKLNLLPIKGYIIHFNSSRSLSENRYTIEVL